MQLKLRRGQGRATLPEFIMAEQQSRPPRTGRLGPTVPLAAEFRLGQTPRLERELAQTTWKHKSSFDLPRVFGNLFSRSMQMRLLTGVYWDFVYVWFSVPRRHLEKKREARVGRNEIKHLGGGYIYMYKANVHVLVLLGCETATNRIIRKRIW